MNFTEKIEEILQKEAQAILDIPVTDQFEKAVELIVEQVHRKGGKLVTSGMGKAGQIAMNIATTFCSTGTPAVFLHHAYDGYRRYSGRRSYGGDSFRRPSICPAPPRRILGNPFQRTKSE